MRRCYNDDGCTLQVTTDDLIELFNLPIKTDNDKFCTCTCECEYLKEKPMTKLETQIKLLKESIEVWEGEHSKLLTKIYTPTHDTDHCPLCAKYCQEVDRLFPTCDDCPICEKTECHQCQETPFFDWRGDKHSITKHQAMIDWMYRLLVELNIRLHDEQKNECLDALRKEKTMDYICIDGNKTEIPKDLVEEVKEKLAPKKDWRDAFVEYCDDENVTKSDPSGRQGVKVKYSGGCTTYRVLMKYVLSFDSGGFWMDRDGLNFLAGTDSDSDTTYRSAKDFIEENK